MQPTPVFLQMLALRFLLYQTRTLLQTCTPFTQYLHYIVAKEDKEDKTPGAQCVQVQATSMLWFHFVVSLWAQPSARCWTFVDLLLSWLCIVLQFGGLAQTASCWAFFIPWAHEKLSPSPSPLWFPPLTALPGCKIVNGFLCCLVLSRLAKSPDQRKPELCCKHLT